MPDDELAVVVTDATGATTTLDSHAASPGNRPRGLQFSTQLGSGWTTGGYNLSRPIDRDNTDQGLLDDVRFVSSSGDIAYEGFIGAMPRSMDDTHTLSVSTAGWMASAADHPFTEIIVDRDLSNWGPTSTTRRVSLLSGGFGHVSDPTVSPDQSGRATLRVGFVGPWLTAARPICEARYDAGSTNTIGRITATGTRGFNVDSANPNWTSIAYLGNTDTFASADSSGNLHAAGPYALSLVATTGARRFALIELMYAAIGGGSDNTEYMVDWSNLAAYGTHGLALQGAAPPYGVTASDVIRYLCDQYCPALSSAGVQDTTYPIAHLVFRDRTKPYDAFLKVNSYHLWNLAVWEDRTLHFSPINLTDWDWEVRHDEIGVTIGLQGDSYESLRNGIVVQYTNVATGLVEVLLPESYAELRDDSIDNPANTHGRVIYGEPFQIPFPTTAADALELGRVRLLEDNQPKAPGSFTVHDRIRDRAGNWQPVWKVRAGDRVRLTSTVNLSDRPRLIHETSYSHDGRSLTIAVDSTIRNLEGFLDRMGTALQAAGLGS
jgi:hypothetical protein